ERLAVVDAQARAGRLELLERGIEATADAQLTAVDTEPKPAQIEAVLAIEDDLAIGPDVARQVIVGRAEVAVDDHAVQLGLDAVEALVVDHDLVDLQAAVGVALQQPGELGIAGAQLPEVDAEQVEV